MIRATQRHLDPKACPVEAANLESLTLWGALLANTAACVIAIIALVWSKRPERTMIALLLLSVVLHTTSIAIRWWRLGHPPVGNGFEMLSTKVWGLVIAVLIGYWLVPRMRAFAAVALPIILMLSAWMLLVPANESTLPPTYDTIWLFVHIGFIKLFIGAALIALGMGGIILLRRMPALHSRLAGLPDDAKLDDQMNRFMAAAFIFDTVGIAAGAIWAEDAWGRYWSWVPLEVWSLVTWLSVGLTLHLRSSFRTGPRTNAWLVIGTFMVAFFTFFGIPFVSTSFHKGMI